MSDFHKKLDASTRRHTKRMDAAMWTYRRAMRLSELTHEIERLRITIQSQPDKAEMLARRLTEYVARRKNLSTTKDTTHAD